MTNEHALKPLSHGTILIVGIKASNVDDELKSHPRIVFWDSQNEHWTKKDMPFNVRAVFMTRFISHNTSNRIMSEARKRGVTVFNPNGTGIIVRQVKELLNINQPITSTTLEEYVQMNTTYNKLQPLKEFIDFTKTNIDNARSLMARAKELGIDTTEASLGQMVGVERRKQNQTAIPRSTMSKLDVSVEILDHAIKELSDMREFLIATVEENRILKARLDKFKKLIEE